MTLKGDNVIDFLPPTTPAVALPLGDSIARLAAKVATEAMEEDVAFDQRLDALKVLTAYHIGMSKIRDKDAPKPEAPTMEAFKQAIAAAEKE